MRCRRGTSRKRHREGRRRNWQPRIHDRSPKFPNSVVTEFLYCADFESHLANCRRGRHLPLLSLTLARLYTNWIDVGGEELTLANYESLGGMRDVVNHEIEQILMGDSHDRQTALGLLRSALFRG
jgi:hypothetical protein